jgi:hypothetical protein
MFTVFQSFPDLVKTSAILDKRSEYTCKLSSGKDTGGQFLASFIAICNCALHMSIERERRTYWSNHITALARIADRCHPFLGAGLTLARIADG